MTDVKTASKSIATSTATPSIEAEATGLAPSSLSTFITPINALLLALFLFLLYRRISSRRDKSGPILTVAEPIVFRDYTPVELSRFNGKDDPKILMAINNKVFDVSAGKAFYGPGGPYRNFAGRDASRGLAKNSFDEDMLTSLDRPIDDLANLNEEEQASLKDWEQHFTSKYIHVGSLVPNDSITP